MKPNRKVTIQRLSMLREKKFSTATKMIDAAIAETLRRCSFCLGPDVEQFEREFAAFCGSPHCVAFNSGTSALHVAMRLLDIGPGAGIHGGEIIAQGTPAEVLANPASLTAKYLTGAMSVRTPTARHVRQAAE